MSGKSEFLTEKLEAMSAVDEASTLLRKIAEPRPVGDSVKSAITRAARRVSALFPLSMSRAEDIWRKEARLIRAEEMDAIRRLADRRIVEEAQRERSELERRISRLEALLVQDEDFYRSGLDALREMAGRKNRPMGGG